MPGIKYDKSKFIPLEEKKLTKKQLQKATFLYSDDGVLLTIGDLNIDQLRTLSYELIQWQEITDSKLQKAYRLIEDCLP